MGELCRFNNIIIGMYPGDHAPPHFHVRFGDYKASFRISDGELESGSLPPKQMKLVQGWWALRQPEIEASWSRAEQKQNPGTIEPLK
jgi:hypothetical protein